MIKCDVVIIGAGAAGLMCALTTGQRGKSVHVIESANKPGKKILMSGGGRCNFTNLNVGREHFMSHNPHFCQSALSRYTPSHFIELVEKYNIAFHEKTLGQLFCDDKSKDILNMLLSECNRVSAKIHLNTLVSQLTRQDNGRFRITTNNATFDCDKVVIATGGLSIPTLGSSPFGYQIAEQFGLNVWPTRAGLVPFTLHTSDKERLAPLSGVSVDCTTNCNGQSFRENMLFTHRGLSGPSMLQISSFWNPGDAVTVNLLPDINVFELLKSTQQQQPNVILKNLLSQHVPKRFAETWLAPYGDSKPLQSYTHKTLQQIADTFQKWSIKPNNTEGYRTAEVTLGGVDCHTLSSKTFETNSIPGLYFIGEVLDVTGWLGGYNFQWAWASGVAAGNAV
ncbi:MAG: aminoacetone oxidase family FAD-binding enzyme [Coxiella sp. (in: Bacteria)]|nr:MAG: aminoacetone oxidase family FAD-binding enzyme [Coxiella sp. (in: g-proteobacteria)]